LVFGLEYALYTDRLSFCAEGEESPSVILHLPALDLIGGCGIHTLYAELSPCLFHLLCYSMAGNAFTAGRTLRQALAFTGMARIWWIVICESLVVKW
jgi:hypothetical protein